MINQYWGLCLNLYNLPNLDTGASLQVLAGAAQTSGL
ncbi:MAG: hypothetical protein V7K97_11670 [Nostoc sp.]